MKTILIMIIIIIISRIATLERLLFYFLLFFLHFALLICSFFLTVVLLLFFLNSDQWRHVPTNTKDAGAPTKQWDRSLFNDNNEEIFSPAFPLVSACGVFSVGGG